MDDLSSVSTDVAGHADPAAGTVLEVVHPASELILNDTVRERLLPFLSTRETETLAVLSQAFRATLFGHQVRLRYGAGLLDTLGALGQTQPYWRENTRRLWLRTRGSRWPGGADALVPGAPPPALHRLGPLFPHLHALRVEIPVDPGVLSPADWQMVWDVLCARTITDLAIVGSPLCSKRHQMNRSAVPAGLRSAGNPLNHQSNVDALVACLSQPEVARHLRRLEIRNAWDCVDPQMLALDPLPDDLRWFRAVLEALSLRRGDRWYGARSDPQPPALERLSLPLNHLLRCHDRAPPLPPAGSLCLTGCVREDHWQDHAADMLAGWDGLMAQAFGWGELRRLEVDWWPRSFGGDGFPAPWSPPPTSPSTSGNGPVPDRDGVLLQVDVHGDVPDWAERHQRAIIALVRHRRPLGATLLRFPAVCAWRGDEHEPIENNGAILGAYDMVPAVYRANEGPLVVLLRLRRWTSLDHFQLLLFMMRLRFGIPDGGKPYQLIVHVSPGAAAVDDPVQEGGPWTAADWLGVMHNKHGTDLAGMYRRHFEGRFTDEQLRPFRDPEEWWYRWYGTHVVQLPPGTPEDVADGFVERCLRKADGTGREKQSA